IRVAIDGPAAAGKSTVAKIVAQKQAFVYIDTGAMYRAVTLKVLNNKIDPNNEDDIEKMLASTTVAFDTSNQQQIVLLDGQDVTEAIRMQDVTSLVSKIAQYKSVREKLTIEQKAMANNQSVVMDGRDIGTAVIPEAELKIFLIASVEERAQRRHEENVKRGFPSEYEAIVEDIKARDQQDYNRTISPLTKADDAIELDTTSLSIDAVAQKINDLIVSIQ